MIIFLTAQTINGETPPLPRVVAVESNDLSYESGKKGMTNVWERRNGTIVKSYKVYENCSEIAAQILLNAGQSTGVQAKGYLTLAAAALGANQGAALALTKYFNEVTTSTASSAEGVRLDGGLATKVRVVINNSAATIKAYPATGEKFSTVAANASLNILANQRKHYVCLATGVWTAAVDYTQVE